MLELKHIYKTFHPGTINERRALCGLDLSLAKGDFVTVIGGNGAGKSTMLNAISGVFPVDAASITIDGVEVARLPEWLEFLQAAGVDAAILADVGVLSLAKRYAPRVQCHISTQASIVNYQSARAWHELGASRVILARELEGREEGYSDGTRLIAGRPPVTVLRHPKL